MTQILLGDMSACDVPTRVIVTASQVVFETSMLLLDSISTELYVHLLLDHADFTVMIDHKAEHSSCRPPAEVISSLTAFLRADGTLNVGCY